MDYVRLVKPEWFDHSGGDAFKELAFRKHTDGTGLSIFDLECAKKKSGLIGTHIGQYYKDVVGDGDRVFCIVSDADFPPNFELIATGDPDPCHWGLDAKNADGKRKGEPIGVNKLKSYFEHRMPRECFCICNDDGTHRPLSPSDVAIWKAKKMLADES
jgi:hypothetical protein